MLFNECRRTEVHRILLNCQNMSYCCCYRLASNSHASFSNKVFSKLADLTGLCIYHMIPQDSVLTLHENHNPDFVLPTLSSKISYRNGPDIYIGNVSLNFKLWPKQWCVRAHSSVTSNRHWLKGLSHSTQQTLLTSKTGECSTGTKCSLFWLCNDREELSQLISAGTFYRLVTS